MNDTLRATWAVVVYLLQRLAVFIIALTALGLAGYVLACGLGLAPWLSLELRFGPYLVQEAGIAVQLAVTFMALTLLFYLPSHTRMMALETSHRNFHMTMRDVARAYAAAHQEDREGAFTLSSEFDSIRDRIAFLRAHPDLDTLEPEVMELAAQMSHISRELARTYSQNNVARARDFLVQRQEDIAEFEDRVRLAKSVAEELTRWNRRVELEESVARSQLEQLRIELADILPELIAEPEPTAPATERIARDDPGDHPRPAPPDLNDEADLYAEDGRIVALLARRAVR
ncbi:DNA repair protein [Aestuariivita sp.]|jgi:hypothetical protein|uniref:DNA repair protein n=1 Tax=Aestuariivita sp. TaxID=1872407 RepID=UPI0025BFC5E7|nr:DNA repair protein [Aestuariivita sp.]